MIDNTTLSSRDHLPREKAPHLAKDNEFRTEFPTPSRSPSPVNDGKEETKAESVERRVSPDLVSIKVEEQELTLSKDQASEAPEEIGEGVGDNDVKVNASKSPVNDEKEETKAESAGQGDSSDLVSIKVEEQELTLSKDQASEAPEEIGEGVGDNDAKVNASKSPVDDEKEETKAESVGQGGSPDLVSIKVEQQELTLPKDQASEAPEEIGEGVGDNDAKVNASKVPLLTPSPTPSRSSSPAPKVEPESESHIKKEAEAIKNAQEETKELTETKKASITSKTDAKGDSEKAKAISERQAEDEPIRQVKKVEDIEAVAKAIVKAKIQAERNATVPSLVSPGDVGYNYKFEEEVKRYLGKGMVYYLLVRPLTQDGLFIHREKAKALNDGVVIKSGYTTRGQKRLDEHEELCGIKPSPCEKFPRAGSVIFAHLLERILQDLWFEKQVDMQCENVGRCNDKHRERYCLSRKVNESLVLAFNRNLDELRPVAMQWVNAIKSLDQVRNLLIDEHNKRRKGYYPDIEL
ncbi:hypothetical protein BGZ58_011068 [Dissophora ornata]|nr:hypothetical protein BGZ58_011068 [Dissophora ornata]